MLLDQPEAAAVAMEALEVAVVAMEAMEVATEAMEAETVMAAPAVAAAVLETEPTLSQLHLRLAAHLTLQSAHLPQLQASHPTPVLLLLMQLALVSLFSDWLLPLPCKEMIGGAFISNYSYRLAVGLVDIEQLSYFLLKSMPVT